MLSVTDCFDIVLLIIACVAVMVWRTLNTEFNVKSYQIKFVRK